MASIEEEMKTNLANDKYKLIGNIVFTGSWITRTFDNYMKPYNLTSPQFNILRILRGAKSWISMHDIKDRMIEKSPNATRLCDKLERKGLLERERDGDDRRVVLHRITKHGLDLLAEIDKDDDLAVRDIIARISDEEARIASKILEKLRG